MSRFPVLVLALLMCVPADAVARRGQGRQPSEQMRTRGHRMLEQVHRELVEAYYDSTLRGIDFDAARLRADSAIDAAQSPAQLMAVLYEFVGALNDSHTRFAAPGINVTVQYGWFPQMIGEECFVVNVTEDSDAEAQGLKVGDRILAIDAIRPTRDNSDLISLVYYQLSTRPGMRLVVLRPDGTQEELTIRSEIERRPPVQNLKDLDQIRFLIEIRRRAHHSNHHIEVFGDSVMVWRMHSFQSGRGRHHYDRLVDAHMEEARKYPHLILDLRGNGGGLVATEIRLLSHFFAEETLILSEHRRDRVVERHTEPTGRPPYDGNVMVLIDSRTGSASEITARTLQLRGRATIIGDRSAGAVMTSMFHPLTLGTIFDERVTAFGVSITVSDVIMTDGNSLEHNGVIPNIALLPRPMDFREERDPALAFALELAGVMIDPQAAFKVFDEEN